MPRSHRVRKTARTRGLRAWAPSRLIHSAKVGVYEIHIRDDEATPIGGGFELPRAFTIEPTDRSRPLLEVEVREGQATCIALTARDGARLSTVNVRQPVDAFVKSATYVLALERTEHPTKSRVTDEPIEAGTWVHAHRHRERDEFDKLASERRRGVRLSDDLLDEVARIYGEAYALGRPPTQAVAEGLHTARSNAGRWVMEARRRGFLPPTEPRKARSQ